MLNPTDDMPSDFCPINRLVQCLVDEATYDYVLSSDKIQAVLHYFAVFRIVMWPNNTFNCVL